MVPGFHPHRTGYLQWGIRRAFWAARRQVLCTRDFLPWCFPGQTSYRRGQYWNVRRAARRWATPIGRRGYWTLWRLKDEHR
jgi:hypothetical protein